MTDLNLPAIVLNVVDGHEVGALAGERFDKLAPATGRPLVPVARSRA